MPRDLAKAAQRGEPSYVWRQGQVRRLEMILAAAGQRVMGDWLENGCGVGMYLEHLAPLTGSIVGLEYEYPRAIEAFQRHPCLVNAAGENLPFATAAFDVILSHEVLEHVQDDRQCVEEILRVLRPGGRLLLFVPNRGYPFETHGIYWRGRYHFGNIPLVNYLPLPWRNRLAPHVRVYSANSLRKLFTNLPARVLQRRVIFGSYDNLRQRSPALGNSLRRLLQWFERTPLQAFGLSHFWVIEKT